MWLLRKNAVECYSCVLVRLNTINSVYDSDCDSEKVPEHQMELLGGPKEGCE